MHANVTALAEQLAKMLAEVTAERDKLLARLQQIAEAAQAYESTREQVRRADEGTEASYALGIAVAARERLMEACRA